MSQDHLKGLCQWVKEAYFKDKDIDKLLEACIKAGWDISSVEVVLKSLGIKIMPSQLVPFPKVRDKINMDLGDRQVHVVFSMKHPHLIVVGNMLSDEECDSLIEMSRPKLKPSKVQEHKTGIPKVVNERTSHDTFFNRAENELISRIENRMARFLDWPVECGDPLQVACYTPGQEFEPHHDYFSVETPNQRSATLLVYLNEPEEGGGIIFPDINLEILPKKGNAVFFSYERPYAYTRTLHSDAPVFSGEKWVVTKWIRNKVYQPETLHDTNQIKSNVG